MRDGSRGTILILEDDAGVARLQQRRLERTGYTVLSAGIPAEALEQLRRNNVELILLDYRLPGQVNGLDFYAQLKAEGRDLPVILVTGFSDDATVIQALRAGVRDFVTKSVEYLDYLPEAVRRVLEQVRTEHQLVESKARLTAIIDSALDAIVTINDGGFITLFNPAAEQVFRCSAREALGQPIHRFMLGGLPVLPVQKPGVTNHAGFWDEMRGLRADGAEFPFEASVAQVEVVKQTITTIIVRDITARKQAEEALRHGNRNLAAALADLKAKSEEVKAMTQQLWQAAKLASVGELAASIAHELNNPLATVSLRVESLLAQTPAADSRRRPLEIIEGETERMSSLVANLLQFSRRGQEQASTLNVREELEKALELVQYHLRRRRITFVQELAPDLPAIFADRQQLRQVFLNLLTNASDAMPEGGTLTLRTRLGTMEGGERAVLIEFTDTGVGIPPEYLAKVMEPFFTTKEEGKGTGLGLAICRRIVHEHRGTITITSEVGQGTTVRLALPVASGTNTGRLRKP